MEIILLERVEKLGQIGDVVTVKNGYARNYLLPQKKALRKTKENLSYFENKKEEFIAHNASLKKEAETLATKLKGLSVIIIRQAAESGQLYGSVTARDICDAVADAGFKIERKQIALKQPFKNIGIFDVTVTLHPDVSEIIRVNIARSETDAKKNLNKKEAAKKDSKKEETTPEVTVES